jgi:hypothetical protein
MLGVMHSRLEFKWDLHNKGHGRLSALPIIWCLSIILHDVRRQRVKLTVTSFSAVCWEEIEENLDEVSARLEHSHGNRNSREHFNLVL